MLSTKLFSPSRLALSLIGAAILTGCTANPLTVGFTKVANLGLEIPKKMTERVTYATVFRSGWVESFARVDRNTAYGIEGILYNSPESEFRAAITVMPNLDSSWLGWTPTAMVPDSIPQLIENDIVMLKQGKTYGGSSNFHQDRQGTIVLGLVCKADAPDYESCKTSLPGYAGHKSKANNRFGGISTYPWYEDNARYGLEFTPMFDRKTGVLLPGAKPVPSRESYVRPDIPADEGDQIKKLGLSTERWY